jgi:hypothetical protein
MSSDPTPATRAAELKDAANALHKAGDYVGAVAKYTQAIDTLPSAMLYTNRAAALLMLKKCVAGSVDLV